MATILCGTVAFPQIQAVLFDKDGTLADSHTYLRHLAQKRARLIDAQIPGVQAPLLMAFGLDRDQLNPAGLMAVGTRRENEIAAAAYVAETGRDWLAALEMARSAFAEADQVLPRKADSTPLFEGTLDLLQRLASVGIKIGILSSDSTANVADFVDRYQLESLVQLSMGSDGTLVKPDPKLFSQACAALELAPTAVLMVGDAAVDLEMATAASAAGCVGVSWGGATAAMLARADAIVRHPSEIQLIPTP